MKCPPTTSKGKRDVPCNFLKLTIWRSHPLQLFSTLAFYSLYMYLWQIFHVYNTVQHYECLPRETLHYRNISVFPSLWLLDFQFVWNNYRHFWFPSQSNKLWTDDFFCSITPPFRQSNKHFVWNTLRSLALKHGQNVKGFLLRLLFVIVSQLSEVSS